MVNKVSTIVLKVDLECARCYNKIRKSLCRYHQRYQIQEEIFDWKQNTVTIRGPFCPKKLARKLCCKARNAIKCIEIVEETPPEILKFPDPPRPKSPPEILKFPDPPKLESPPKLKPELEPPRKQPPSPSQPPSKIPVGVLLPEPTPEPTQKQPSPRPPSRPQRPSGVTTVEVPVEVLPESSPPRQSVKSTAPAPYEEYRGGPGHEGYGGPPQPCYNGYEGPSYFSEDDPNSCIIM